MFLLRADKIAPEVAGLVIKRFNIVSENKKRQFCRGKFTSFVNNENNKGPNGPSGNYGIQLHEIFLKKC